VTGVTALAAALLALSASAMTLGLAAGTAITAQRLTVDTGATSVPLERCTLSPVADSDVDAALNTGNRDDTSRTLQRPRQSARLYSL
jgi:hypothetical protein